MKGVVLLLFAWRSRDRVHQGLWVFLEVVKHEFPLLVIVEGLVREVAELALLE